MGRCPNAQIIRADDVRLDSWTEVLEGYRRVDNTDQALRRSTAAYGNDWTKDDIFFYVYGLLHSPDYRQTYAADLKKMLPRIPLVAAANARAFADAGRRLSDLHLHYELASPHPLEGLDLPAEATRTSGSRSATRKVKMLEDRTAIRYNDRITLRGIPAAAYRYMLGSRSANGSSTATT